MRPLQSITLILALIASLAMAQLAQAADVIKLRDGSTLSGEIVKEADAYLYIRVKIGSIEQERFILKADIIDITRDAIDSEAEAQPQEQDQQTQQDDALISSTATRVAFLRTSIMETGADMVGPFLNGTEMSKSVQKWLELPESQQPDVVVLIIDSGGGAVAEMEAIVQAIHVEMKEHFRPIAWIKQAYSGAAFTAMNCEEIVFMEDGAMGGNVMWFGNGTAGTGEAFQEMLEIGREVSANGGINPLVMWAMQMFMTLSADINPETGEVTWYDTDQGEFIVSREDEVLTLNAYQAEKFGISKGTADTKQELMDVLGIEEWVEVGQDVNEQYIDFLDGVLTAQNRISEFYRKFSIALGIAQSPANEREFRQQIRVARSHISRIRTLARRAPSLQKYGVNGVPAIDNQQPISPEWFRAVDEMIDDIVDDYEDR